MGRKKKPTTAHKVFKPICYYCEKEYPDEEKLVNHQRATHFRCPQCPKRLDNVRGLAAHLSAIHNQEIDQIPHALSDRKSEIDLLISGLRGVPSAFILRKAAGTDLEDFILENRVNEHPFFRDK